MRAAIQACLAILILAGCAAGGHVHGDACSAQHGHKGHTGGYFEVKTVFAEPELADCRNLAVLVKGEPAGWAKGEMEAAFMAEYRRVFSDCGVTFVERADIGDVIAQPGDKDVQAVDAVVSLESYVKKVAGPGSEKIDALHTLLTAAIVNARTGIVIGSVIIADELSRATAAEMCRKAIEALKAEVEKSR